MARTLRVKHAGAIHHVMNRGARRERIFVGDAAKGSVLDIGKRVRERFSILEALKPTSCPGPPFEKPFPDPVPASKRLVFIRPSLAGFDRPLQVTADRSPGASTKRWSPHHP